MQKISNFDFKQQILRKYLQCLKQEKWIFVVYKMVLCIDKKKHTAQYRNRQHDVNRQFIKDGI